MDFVRIIKHDLTGDLTTQEPTIRQHVMRNRLFHEQYAKHQLQTKKRRKESNYRPVPKLLFPSALERVQSSGSFASGDMGASTLVKIKKQVSFSLLFQLNNLEQGETN